MVITINTDASFSKKHKVGAFACWVVSRDFKFKTGGLLRAKVDTPTRAECMAILNALHLVFKYNMVGIKMIIVNTDSMDAKHVFENNEIKIKKYRLNKYFAQFYGIFTKMKETSISPHQKIEFQFRHVKAHTNTDTPRTYINDWCDKEAKKHLGRHLEKLEKHENHKENNNTVDKRGGGNMHVPGRAYIPVRGSHRKAGNGKNTKKA